MKVRTIKYSEMVAKGSLSASDYFWKQGTPSYICANCGRANIYHDPETGACPAPNDEMPKVK